MSLIDEALKRAQEEAARRDPAGAGRKAHRWAAGPVFLRRRPPPALVATIVAASLGAGLGLGFWIFSRPATPERVTPERVVGAAATPPEVAETAGAGVPAAPAGENGPAAAEPPSGAAGRSPEATPEPSLPPVTQASSSPAAAAQEAPATGGRPAPATTPMAGSGRAVAVSRKEAERPAGRSTSQPDHRPPHPAAETTAGADHTFHRQATVGGGVTLSLQGIAFSPENPVAVINGQITGAGEAVAGWTVVEVLADRVRLKGPDGEVTLLLK